MAEVSAVQGGAGSIFDAYRVQIEALKADPNATPEYKQALDQWMQALEAALQAAQNGGGATSDAATNACGQADTSGSTPANSSEPSENDVAASSETGQSQTLSSSAPAELQALAPQIQAASEATGVPANLLAAMIWQESRGNANASSSNGGNGLTDGGLMQVNEATFADLQTKHPELQGKSLSDPETNILAGALYLKDLKDQFGSWDLALRAYNSGPNSVDPSNANTTTTGLGDPTFVEKVTSYWKALESGGGLPA